MPRLTLAKLYSVKRALEMEITLSQQELSRREARILELLDGLQGALGFIDLMQRRAGKQPLPLLDGFEVKRLDEIRKYVPKETK